MTTAFRKVLLGVSILCGLAAGPAGGSPPPPPDTRYERAWSVAAGLGDGEGLPRTRSGLVRVRQLARLLVALRTGRVFDEQTTRLRQAIREGLSSLDVEDIYDLLADRGTAADGTRTARFTGRFEEGHYYIDSVAPGADAPEPARFGDGRSAVSFRPGWDGYVIGLEGDIHLGGVRLPHIVELLGSLVRYLEALPRDAAPDTPEPRGPAEPIDQAVLAGLRAAVPDLYGFLRPYARLEDVVLDASDAGTRYHVRLALDVEGLRADYPLLADKLEGMRGLARVNARVTDRDGRTIAVLTASTDPFALEASFALRAGAVVPMDEAGRIDTAHPGYDPLTVTRFDGTIVTDAHLDVSGLRLDVLDWETELAYRRGPDGAGLFATRYHRPPSLRVHGAALGIVPPWLIDALIPGTIESIAREFLETLATGDNGRGLWFRLEMPGLDAGGGETFRFRGAGELRSNGFVSFLLKIARWRLYLEPQERDEMAAFREGLYGSLLRDVDRAASYFGALAN